MPLVPDLLFSSWGMGAKQKPGSAMMAEVGHPFAAAQARVFPWQPRQAAPARPLAEERNWASVCVSWEPYLVANTQKNLEVASKMLSV